MDGGTEERKAEERDNKKDVSREEFNLPPIQSNQRSVCPQKLQFRDISLFLTVKDFGLIEIIKNSVTLISTLMVVFTFLKWAQSIQEDKEEIKHFKLESSRID